MNRTIGVVMIAGLCVQASEASDVRVHTTDRNYILRMEGGPEQVDTSSGAVTFTFDVIGDAEEGLGTHMLWGSFGLEILGSAEIADVQWSPAEWTEFNFATEYDGHGTIEYIEFGQWDLLGSFPRDGSELGSSIGQFQITLAQNELQSGELEFRFLQTRSFALSTIHVDTHESYYSTPEVLILDGFSLNVVPAPASTLLLVGSGCVLIRRKR